MLTASKALFQRDKDLAAWWNAIAHDERFAKVLVFVRSDFLDLGLDGQALTGGKAFEAALRAIGENDDARPQFIASPGLEHDLDAPREEKKPKKPHA